MNTPKEKIQITLLGKPYTMACAAGEGHRLKEAAQYLEQKVKMLQLAHQTAPTEALAIMAALDLAHELLTQKAESLDYRDALEAKMRALTVTLGTALDPA